MVTRSGKNKSEKKLPSNDGMATRTLSLRAYANKPTTSGAKSTKKTETMPKGAKIESVSQKIKGRIAAENKTATRGRTQRGKNIENTGSLRRSSRSVVLEAAEKEQFRDHKYYLKNTTLIFSGKILVFELFKRRKRMKKIELKKSQKPKRNLKN